MAGSIDRRAKKGVEDRLGDPVDNDAEDRVIRIYERHAPAVTAYALRRTSATDAPDTVAETFLVAWRRRDVIPPEPDVLPWLYGVARNVLANQRRGDRRRTQLADKLTVMFVDNGIDPPSLEEAEEFSRVARAIRQLSDDDAEVLRLASWEALTPTEIAAVLNLEPGNARQRLHRARRRLRAQLELDDEESYRLLTSGQEGAKS